MRIRAASKNPGGDNTALDDRDNRDGLLDSTWEMRDFSLAIFVSRSSDRSAKER